MAQHMPVFPALHPLAVGDVVLMRTTTNLLAIDFQTGKRLWQTEDEKEPAQSGPTRVNGGVVFFNGQMVNVSQPALYGQRIWEDATYGTLSSDGRLVFVIEELPLGLGGGYPAVFFGGMGGRGDPSSKGIGDVLAAYDIKTGKLQWKLGGEPDSIGPGLEPNDTFFLGPPLPLRGQLYVMAEINGEIRLLALDGATGNRLWSQQLAMVDSNITQDPIRRMAGVSPSYSDGVLICPTGVGCVVAVNLANRSLLWGYIYSHPGEQVAGPPGMGRRIAINRMMMINGNGLASRWIDSNRHDRQRPGAAYAG